MAIVKLMMILETSTIVVTNSENDDLVREL